MIWIEDTFFQIKITKRGIVKSLAISRWMLISVGNHEMVPLAYTKNRVRSLAEVCNIESRVLSIYFIVNACNDNNNVT